MKDKGQRLKISVIGIGHLGTIHAKLLKQNNYGSLEGIYDIDFQRAEKSAQELCCKAFRNLNDLIKSSDAVIISTPTTTHFKIAKKCIENSLHCFIEKPMTATYQQAIQLIKLAAEKNIIIQVGHVERFNPALKAIMKYNPNPLFIESHRLSQFKARATDVSVISDLMIHDIDIVLWLVKAKIKEIYANGVAVLTDTIDIANARLEFENGVVANLTASRISAKPTRKMRIFQRDSYFSLDFAKHTVEIFRIVDNDDKDYLGSPALMLGDIEDASKKISIVYESPSIEDGNAIVEEHNSFCRAIMFGEKIPISAYEASQALRVSERIEKKIIKSLKLFQS